MVILKHHGKIIQNAYLVLLVPGYQLVLIFKNWTENTWDLAGRRRSTMKRKIAKKKEVVQSDFSDDNSFNDRITTPQGCTAWGRPHLCGNSSD